MPLSSSQPYIAGATGAFAWCRETSNGQSHWFTEDSQEATRRAASDYHVDVDWDRRVGGLVDVDG